MSLSSAETIVPLLRSVGMKGKETRVSLNLTVIGHLPPCMEHMFVS